MRPPRRRRALAGGLLAAAALLAPGCGTFLSGALSGMAGARAMAPYSGAQLDLFAIASRDPAGLFLGLLDLPLSLTLDTLLLPITLPGAALRR